VPSGHRKRRRFDALESEDFSAKQSPRVIIAIEKELQQAHVQKKFSMSSKPAATVQQLDMQA